MSKVVLSRQTADNECGLCCIAMVASYFRYYISVGELRDRFQVGRDGLSAKDLAQIISDIGLNATAFRVGDFNNFKFNRGIYIIHLLNNHYIVIVSNSKNNLIAFDPQNGKQKINTADLSKVSSGIILSISKTSQFHTQGKRQPDFKYLYATIRKSLSLLAIVTIISITSYIISLVIPVSMQQIIDMVISHTRIDILSVIFFILCFIGITMLVTWIRNRETILLQRKLLHIITLDSVRHLFKIKYSFFDSRHHGDILFRLNLLNQFQSLVSNSFVQCLIALTCICVLACYLLLEFEIIGLLIIIYMLCIGCISYILGLRLSELKQEEYSSRKRLESVLVEVITNMLQIRMLHMDDFFFGRYRSEFKSYINIFSKTEKKLQNFNMVITVLFTYSPVIITLALFVSSAKSSVGQLFALFSILTTFSNQILNLIMQVTSFVLLKSTIYLVNDLLDEKEQKDEGHVEISKFQSLEIKNLKFRYSTKASWALDDVCINVKKGETVAIVGRSGSGKTTLVKILSKLYQYYDGKIFLNENNLLDVSDTTLSQVIGVVPQLPVYFNMSIKDNLTLGDVNISPSVVKRALQIANFYDEVMKMPMQLETIVSGQGGNLSGGQIQKLSIARAIIRSPQLLILDEATSSMDPQNEKVIYSNLNSENIATLVVSHRLSTVINATRIYVMEHGHVVEFGTHLSLMEKQGRYYELFTNQTSR